MEASKREETTSTKMTRTDIINGLISKHGLKRYLEIGIHTGANFNRVICPYKVSVDPAPEAHATFKMTSDQFFAIESVRPYPFDIIFIDGLHHEDQVSRDMKNAFRELSYDGFIICHDMNPMKEIEQRVPRETKRWNGDSWKALVKLRHENPDVSVVTVDTDEGCAIIRKVGKLYPFRLTRELTFENLQKHRQEWLNLISVDQFKRIYL